MAQLGLLNWANSIRLAMASDPGRQVFKEEVQTHGFLFLDDYYDSIASGAKQDPLIELVKTPGRKKAIARKPKLMSSKLGNMVSLSFNDDAEDENVPPANVFAAPNPFQSTKSSKPLSQKGKSPAPPLGPEMQGRNPFAPIQPVPNAKPLAPAQDYVQPPEVTRAELLVPTSSEHNDLSIIAEDEEPAERSRTSLASKAGDSPLTTTLTNASKAPEVDVAPRPPSPPIDHDQENNNDDKTSSSMGSFHSIPLLSPSLPSRSTQEDVKQVETPLTTEPERPREGEAPSESVAKQPVSEVPMLPVPKESEDTQGFKMGEVHDDAAANDRKSHDKHAGLAFPTLPDPTIIRKSRAPSITATMLGAATPGTAVGKRTSWLMKAREVKALETFPKKQPGSASNVINPSSSSQGTKRKSDDFLSIFDSHTEDIERQPKAAKTAEGDIAPRHSKEQPKALVELDAPQDGDTQHTAETAYLDRLKKTVEGFGIRTGKSAGKSFGGDAATLLAEARKAAEARIAERDRKEEEVTMAMGLPSLPLASEQSKGPAKAPVEATTPVKPDDKMDISELFPSAGKVKEKHKAPEKPLLFKALSPESKSLAREPVVVRDSTTPANSPPKSVAVVSPPPPVFKKPPPVFTAPVPSSVKPEPVFTKPPFSSVFKPKSPAPLTAHSTIESLKSDKVFDNESGPSWMPETQDTEYTSGYDTEPQPLGTQICDEDDSWPMDEKLAEGVQWTFGGGKDDSMTWSTQFTHSHRADTGPIATMSPAREESPHQSPSRGHPIPGAFDADLEEDDGLDHDAELEEVILGSSKAASKIPQSAIPRSESQLSLASTESSQSNAGFLSQASKLISSALGTGKKKQPEVKVVLQKAAVAAKKQQEEADKKAARLKEMENRRQQAIQRKAEEEKARQLEEERKAKEEAERRKKEKEKEGNTEKRALKLPSNKKEEESQKKRKIESGKKSEIKKPGPSSTLFGKAHLKTPLKKSVLNSATAYGSLPQAAASSSSHTTEHAGTSKGKETDHQHSPMDEDVPRPAQHIQSQMAARAKAQIDAAKVDPPMPSESIELPDINSEYSDSDDEDRVRTFDPPDWAQSPELRQALENQRSINPDDIFGAVRPLKMEEIFKTRTSRFRARTSSANWTGADRLTMQEQSEYARRMGFK
ncbi:hypothetical protein D9613_001797 [Agrocybe pediades]|uniref:Inner centromere protein ARK-binding domain-containing protein n=1 Tax=Agrocybe pediades TaxID=84607 RepID=A0A8H4R555_9AGAR|nr:hypothetical protein D9613_001797 [Agrocybe pediades]